MNRGNWLNIYVYVELYMLIYGGSDCKDMGQ